MWSPAFWPEGRLWGYTRIYPAHSSQRYILWPFVAEQCPAHDEPHELLYKKEAKQPVSTPAVQLLIRRNHSALSRHSGNPRKRYQSDTPTAQKVKTRCRHSENICMQGWKLLLQFTCPFCGYICFQEDRDYIFICEVKFHIKDKNIDVVKRLKYNCS